MQAITILGVLAAFGLLFLSLLALCAARGFRPLAGVRRFYGRLSALGRIFFLALVGAFIVYASTKSDGSTNAPSARMSAQRRSLAVQPGVVIFEAETNLGYRVLAVRDGDEIVPPGIEAVTNAAWRLRGGMMDAFRIGMVPEPTEEEWMLPAGPAWSFPWRAAWTHGLTVFANGEFQPSVRDDFFPRPFGTNLSIAPQAKWGEIADGSLESLFWHELTPSNSLVLTWQNALYGRDANAPTNFQAELFGDGSFDYRYPDRTVSYAPVFPFDWDGDGLENSVDPEPRVAGPDAHGTNAEWYNNVCSNVFVAVEGTDGPILAPRHAGVNTNAYYFVDVVAERGPAPIYFISSHPGRLGSPVVVTLGGETNRVPLLIGATYSVSSDVPFTVSGPTNGFAEISWSDGTNAMVKWPLNFTFTEELLGTSRSYTVDVGPFDPGGTFSWGHDHGGAALQSFSLDSFECGCVTTVGNVVQYGCSSLCTCGGLCAAHGSFVFENTLFEVRGGECRCGLDDPGFDYSFEPAPTTGPVVDISFSRPVVIFEDEFENSPGVFRPRRSTRVRLKVMAYGGPHGGHLSCTGCNLEKLQLISGGTFDFLEGKDLLPYEYYVTNYICEGVAPSMLASDVQVEGTFTESETGVSVSDDVALSVVRVELTPRRPAPANQCAHRHSFGVFELVDCVTVPSVPGVLWQLHGGGTTPLATDGFLDTSVASPVLRCPLTNNFARLEVCCQGARYCPIIDYVEPTDIIPERVDYRFPGTPSRGYYDAGDIALWVYLYIYPKTVNFEEISLVEVPWLQGGSCSGYYASPDRSTERYHDEYHGAGKWKNVTTGNFWSLDRIGCIPIQDWEPGRLVWDIPIGWNRLGSLRGTLPVKNVGMFHATFDILMDGTVRVEKFGEWVSRGLSTNPEGPDNGKVFLNGEERNVQQDMARWLEELMQGDEVVL